VNRKTQYENPVLQAKRLKREREEAERANVEYRPQNQAPYYCNTDQIEMNGEMPPMVPSDTRMTAGRPFFTRDPKQLVGDIISSSLLKGPRGLGFTIVGGDDHEEEFLQIKSVVPYGPAWEDGRLQTGDVLVYVNNTCVLGFTHHDMVSMFQGIGVGERVDLTVCRGYPLPFDPNDPNTEIVTTVAVSSAGK
jgi:C-terminal processing protease CtpA/Prc